MGAAQGKACGRIIVFEQIFSACCIKSELGSSADPVHAKLHELKQKRVDLSRGESLARKYCLVLDQTVRRRSQYPRVVFQRRRVHSILVRSSLDLQEKGAKVKEEAVPWLREAGRENQELESKFPPES
ncbi:hypothetical protein R1flu_000914 [Riccia fluitans]|uniref:Uncharacterized protein n=1 Tax=Riccia fluitans TaxID=41844 RepID=A0ABD1Y2S0_9MARC